MRILHTATVAALFLAIAAARAGDLPKLPKGLPLPAGEDSPGKVTFNHDTHVDSAKPSCVACHPRLFPMLKGSALPKGAITHEKMDRGQLCGACHGKGKAAFDFSDDNCQNCHAG